MPDFKGTNLILNNFTLGLAEMQAFCYYVVIEREQSSNLKLRLRINKMNTYYVRVNNQNIIKTQAKTLAGAKKFVSSLQEWEIGTILEVLAVDQDGEFKVITSKYIGEVRWYNT